MWVWTHLRPRFCRCLLNVQWKQSKTWSKGELRVVPCVTETLSIKRKVPGLRIHLRRTAELRKSTRETPRFQEKKGWQWGRSTERRHSRGSLPSALRGPRDMNAERDPKHGESLDSKETSAVTYVLAIVWRTGRTLPQVCKPGARLWGLTVLSSLDWRQESPNFTIKRCKVMEGPFSALILTMNKMRI